MGEAATEINDVKPSILKHVVGQRGVVDVVSTELQAAFADERRFDHALMVGPPGTGKTTISHIIADEMAVPVTEVLGQSLSSLAELNATLFNLQPKSVLFVDEAAELDPTIQIALYLALDQSRIVVPSSRRPVSLDIADFTLLLATTHEADLLQPLRDRMRLVLRFQFYDEAELGELVRQRAKGLRWTVDEPVLPEIAKRAKGTPRLALRLLQSCRRVCRAAGEHSITIDHLRRACELEEIDALGLGPTESKYLSLLTNGPTRLNVMASLLGLPSRTVSEVTEPFLIRAGLVVKDEQGRRALTQKGIDHVR